MRIGKSFVVLGLIWLVGCSSTEPTSFDETLYSGMPVDSLSVDEENIPQTEKQAIVRGDRAYSTGNLDLALYEYIRSLSFENGIYKDKTLYNIGMIHLAKSNSSIAERAFLMSLDENPDNIKTLEQLGVFYTRLGDTEQGKSYFLRSVNADQIRQKSSANLSSSRSVTLEEAKTLLVEVNASPTFAYAGLGVLYDVEKENELAQVFHGKALQIDPKSEKVLNNIGYSYYLSGSYRSAQRYLFSALEVNPNNEKAKNNLALTYIAQGQVNRALNVFKSQMSEPEALNNIGYILILQDKPEEAVPYLKQAIDTQPTYYQVANENLERALSMMREEKS
ncbi:tetratricopeptide repeat protein [Vibrio maerlii]|uniref:tetratricopeptide repeat protein n=1 Tax=Vibrio maerlii TaxID=2231648 RepID=UPI000E3B5910|nr:tetratricopeptide repeat protein [Vibrio maerlii]